MTEETQALVDRLREWVDGQSVTYASVLMEDAAAALTSLARDLAAARQERDAALLALSVARDVAHEYQQQGEKLEGEIDAAVRAARAETDKAVDVVRRYAKHPPSCPKGTGVGFYKPPADAECDCGIDAVLTATVAREGQ